MWRKKDNYANEDPFRFLKAKNDGKEACDIVNNWYIARAYVMKKLKIVDCAFKPNDKSYLHVIVENDSSRMLFVVRQIALMAHFLNFREDSPKESERHRTIITIVSKTPEIREILERDEYLCNLPKYCKYVDRDGKTDHANSFVDIEIHIASNVPQEKDKSEKMLYVKEADVDEYFKQYEKSHDDESVFLIDARAAFYASKVYDIGMAYTNIPAEDIHCTKRYAMALSIFKHDILRLPPEQLYNDVEYEKAKNGYLSISDIKKNVSNILCADCFKMREKSMELICRGEKVIQDTWEDNNESLSKSEHARWVVEKLILGYRPLNPEEQYHLDSLHAELNSAMKKKQFLDKLKNRDEDMAHVDLCSYSDLRRIKPEDLKYDSFLMLAIPEILKRVKEHGQ